MESLDSVNYKINFKDFNDCISVAGHVMTTDSSSTVFVTEKDVTWLHIDCYDTGQKVNEFNG